MPGSLDTTNTMLAIIAGVALLQAIVIIGLGLAGWKIYRLATETIREIDDRRVKPIAAKVDGLLDRAHQLTDQVHQLTDRVQKKAEKVEAAIDDTMGRVNHTATAAKSTVTDTVQKVSEAVGGIRAALVNALTTEGDGQRQAPRFAHTASATSGVQGAPAVSVTPVAPVAPAVQHDNEQTRRVREGGF
jgi:uncharacterized protein YoxC